MPPLVVVDGKRHRPTRVAGVESRGIGVRTGWSCVRSVSVCGKVRKETVLVCQCTGATNGPAIRLLPQSLWP